jgi:hypothetical protein
MQLETLVITEKYLEETLRLVTCIHESLRSLKYLKDEKVRELFVPSEFRSDLDGRFLE